MALNMIILTHVNLDVSLLNQIKNSLILKRIQQHWKQNASRCVLGQIRELFFYLTGCQGLFLAGQINGMDFLCNACKLF